MDFHLLKAVIRALLHNEPEAEFPAPATLEFTEPTLLPGELGLDRFRAFALAFLGSAWPKDVEPILEYLASLERWDDYVDLDDQNLLPTERSIVVQKLAGRLQIPLTERQAARFIAYDQIKGRNPYGIEWFRLAQLDPDLRPIFDVHFMYRSTDSANFTCYCGQLVAEYEPQRR